MLAMLYLLYTDITDQTVQIFDLLSEAMLDWHPSGMLVMLKGDVKSE